MMNIIEDDDEDNKDLAEDLPKSTLQLEEQNSSKQAPIDRSYIYVHSYRARYKHTNVCNVILNSLSQTIFVVILLSSGCKSMLSTATNSETVSTTAAPSGHTLRSCVVVCCRHLP